MTATSYKFYFLVILLLINIKASSQSPIFNYLKYNSTQSNVAIDSIINFYNIPRFHKPFISRLSLRTETDEYKLEKQEYSLRAQTNSISYNKYQNKINKLEQDEWIIKKKLIYTDQLYKKYKELIKLFGVILLKNAQTEYIKSIEKQLELLNLKSGIGSSINFEKHLDLNLKLLNAKNELSDLIIKQNICQKDSLLNTNLNFQLDKLISNEDIIYVTNYLPISNSSHSFYENDANKQQLEYQQNIKDATKKLDYLQIRYHEDPTDPVSQKLSIGAGFRIPMFGSNQKIKDEYELKRLTSSFDQLKENDAIKYKLVELNNQLNRLVELYNNMDEKRKFILQKFNPDLLATNELSNPFFISEIRQELAKIAIDQVAQRNEILNLYIQIIFTSGALYKNPERYYLEYPFIEF